MITLPHFQLRRWWPAFIAAASLVAACGGGGIGSGGTGNTGGTSGVAVGTVGGFGSIFVGGVRCDDTRAKIGSNTTTGAPDPANPDVKLGQSVTITFDPAAATCKVLQALVDPEIVGVVSSTSPLTVAGQPVIVNNDATVAPATVFEGYVDASGIQVGDRVEVHGKVVMSGGVPSILASRIEHKPATDTWVRVKGVVKNLAGGQFTIGGLTVKTDSSTQLDPSSLTLANDETVVVWSTNQVAGDGSVTARFVKLAVRPLAADQVVRVEGPASGCSAAPCTQPTIDGLATDLSGATFAAGSQADVANGVFLRVEGTWDATQSKLVVKKAVVRKLDLTAGDVTLIGLVSDYVDNTSFSVRGVPVTSDGSTVFDSTCAPLHNGSIVGIKGRVSQSQVLATKVDCLALADGLTLDSFGVLLNVDTTAKTFNFSEGAFKNYTFTWDDNTVFGNGLTAAGLANNQRVGLRAVVITNGSQTQLLVKRIIDDPLPTNAPAGVNVFGNFGIAQDLTAGSLTVRRIQMAIQPGTTNIVGNVVDGTLVRTWFYRTGPAQPFIALEVREVVWN
jgi:hypothetical protein